MKNHIQYFSSDILNKIFSYLSDDDICNSVPFVCEKWKLASSHSLLLKHAKFNGNSVSCDNICFVLHNKPLLKSISLVSVDNVVPILRHICRCNKQIEKLILKNCSPHGTIVPEDVLINVLLSLSHLRSIELKNTKFVSHTFFETVARQSLVTSVDVSLNEYVTVSDLMTLAHNSKITEFKISRRYKQPKISDREMAHIIKTMKPNLVILHLDMSGLGNYTYEEIFSCSKLKELKMNNAMNLHSQLLIEMPKVLKKLEHLKIEGPSIIAPGDLYQTLFANGTFAAQLVTLKIEYFSSLSNDECCKILEACHMLRTLSIEGCKALTIQGIKDVLVKKFSPSNLNVAFIGISSGIANLLHSPQLNTLIVDEKTFELNGFSRLSRDGLNIVQLKHKYKVI